jgi:outer membrane beta-barrel protein
LAKIGEFPAREGTNVAETNDFNYYQDVYSLYNSYQLNLDKWTVKGGLRLEHTVVNANFTSGAITIVAANVYAKYLTIRTVSGAPDFSQVSNNQSYYRFFMIRFNYRFGKLNSEIKKNQHGINNDDIKSGD